MAKRHSFLRFRRRKLRYRSRYGWARAAGQPGTVTGSHWQTHKLPPSVECRLSGLMGMCGPSHAFLPAVLRTRDTLTLEGASKDDGRERIFIITVADGERRQKRRRLRSEGTRAQCPVSSQLGHTRSIVSSLLLLPNSVNQ